jgi:hypothetical protein
MKKGRGRVKKGLPPRLTYENQCQEEEREHTQYYERRQRLAPITGPAAKPRVRNGKPRKDPFSCIFPLSYVYISLGIYYYRVLGVYYLRCVIFDYFSAAVYFHSLFLFSDLLK